MAWPTTQPHTWVRPDATLRLGVRPDMSALSRRLRALESEAPRAVTRALNRTAQQVATRAVRAVAEDTGLKQKDVRPAVKIERATFSRLVAAVIATGQRIPLSAFRPRQVAKGVVTRLGAQVVRSAFIQTMQSGHVGVWRRKRGVKVVPIRGRYKGAVSKRTGQPLLREPIFELFGPSVARAVRKHVADLRTFARDAYRKNLAHNVSFLLRGRGAGAGEDAA